MNTRNNSRVRLIEETDEHNHLGFPFYISTGPGGVINAEYSAVVTYHHGTWCRVEIGERLILGQDLLELHLYDETDKEQEPANGEDSDDV